MSKANREQRRREEKARRSAGASAPSGGQAGRPSTGIMFGAGAGRSAPNGPTPGRATPGRATPGRATPDPAQALATLLDSALAALRYGDHPSFDRLCDALGMAAVSPGGAEQPRLLERGLRTRLLDAVAAAWGRGWQPADLVRYVRRDLGAPHLRLVGAVIAADLDRYAADTIDPRWRTQLSEADISIWWPQGETFLSASAGVTTSGWFGLVPVSLELLNLVLGVNDLAHLGPVPGRGRITPVADARTDVDERLLARVRALLAKAESTTFPAEAETFTAGAQALMARHSIDAALLAASADPASGGRTDVKSIRIGIDNPYENPKAVLLNAVAGANRCKAVWSQHYGFASVVGFSSDLESVELLFTSLLVQATSGLTATGANAGAGARSRSRSFRISYLLSFATRIGERLTETIHDQTEQAAQSSPGTNLLPVLAARVEAVEEAFTQMYPTVVQRSSSRASDAAGWASGRTAADRASLNARTPLPSPTG